MRSNGLTTRPPNRTYTAQEKAEAVGLALSVGPVIAGDRLGIPRRTVAAWTSGERGNKALAPIIEASREQIAGRLWEALQRATEAVMEGLADPHARLSDRARALEVVTHAHALMTGAATSRAGAEIAPPFYHDWTEEEKQALRKAAMDELARREAEDAEHALVSGHRQIVLEPRDVRQMTSGIDLDELGTVVGPDDDLG